MNASDKDGVNDRGDNQGKNAMLYGVKAYKSYFMLGDYMIALGAGITNLHPEMDGNIRTTIEQTEKQAKYMNIKATASSGLCKTANLPILYFLNMPEKLIMFAKQRKQTG